MKKYILIFLLVLALLLCACTQAPAPTDPTEPSVGATEPQTDPTEPPTDPPTDPEPTEAAIPLPEIHATLINAGFEHLTGEAYINVKYGGGAEYGELRYIYTADDPVIELPFLGLTLTVPDEWFGKVYIVADVSDDGTGASLAVLNQKLTIGYSTLYDTSVNSLMGEDYDYLAKGGRGWNIYMFRLSRIDKAEYDARFRDACYHIRGTVVAETDESVCVYKELRLCPECQDHTEYSYRGVAIKRMGETLYNALDGDWIPTADEVKAMITIDEDAP